MRCVAWVAVALLAVSAAQPAQGEKRIALLIGNQGYDASVGKLKNPHNDIAAVGQALAAQGFELIPPIKDARRSVMLGGVRELVRRLNAAGPGAIGFLYYSGHGAAEKDSNVNYLIPVEAKEPGTTTFWDESLKLDDVLALLDGARSAAKFIVFDACRNELQLPTKDTTKGLVPVAEQQGMFVAYATTPGRTASDRGVKSGPYAAALAAELAKPGLDHLNLFQNVKESVLVATGGAQQPWESNGLSRRVYLSLASAREPVPGQASPEGSDKEQSLVPQGPFDGKWTIAQKSSNCSIKHGTFIVTIVNGVVRGNARGNTISGTVSTSGTAKWAHDAAADGKPVEYSGSFRDSTGSGTYARTDGKCGGTFTALRN